jgi:tetratricopeptide (TPR) repeat protein
MDAILFPMKFRWMLACVVAVFSLVGCASLSPEEQAARDRVLNQYRQAATAMRQARFVDAKAVLDDALLSLGGISAGDKTAKEARSYFREESRKNFRGEPYERVMVYYYRGILYWMDGEPDNARACFRSAAIQDADPEQHTYESDYVLLDYLDGFASTKLRGDGSDAFKRAQKVARLAQPAAYDVSANVLVFVEMGRGPEKYAAGEYREQLHFSPGSSVATYASVVVDGGMVTATAPAYDDLSYQAVTRGGRQMDYILANKAVFKGTTDVLGDAALISGGALVLSGGDRATEVGAGLMVAGLISKIVSSATTPEADTRMWDNLPNLLGFTALRAPPGHHSMVVEFRNAGGQPTLRRELAFDAVDGRDTVIFVSDRN